MAKKILDIEYGMVIDHITPGRGTEIANVLKRRVWQEGKYPIDTGEGHYGTSRQKDKDFVKLDGKRLDEGDDALNEAIISDLNATINWVENSRVVKKKVAYECLSKVINTDIIKCANTNCISHEEAPGRFYVLKRDPLEARCHYCTREFPVKIK